MCGSGDVCGRLRSAGGHAPDTQLYDRQQRQRKLFELLELHGKDLSNLSDLTQRLRELKHEREQLEQQRQALEEPSPEKHFAIDHDSIPRLASLIRQTLHHSPAAKTRSFLSSFIKEVTAEADKITMEYAPHKAMNHGPRTVVHSTAIWLPDLGSNQGHTD